MSLRRALDLTDASLETTSANPRRRGGSLPRRRVAAKRAQTRALLRCVLPMIPSPSSSSSSSSSSRSRLRVVDFAGGSGHLAIPLALVAPHCEVVVVDLKKTSLDILHRRAVAVAEEIGVDGSDLDDLDDVDDDPTRPPLVRPTAIPNLLTCHAPISDYGRAFHVGVALHACGEATDSALRECGRARANFVSCPCCVGKLSTSTKNDPYVYRATNANEPTVTYPQSSVFRRELRLGGGVEDWNALVKAADFGEHGSAVVDACRYRKVAKSLVEMDRLIYMKETFRYDGVALTKMEAPPNEDDDDDDAGASTPKNDVLLGWFDDDDENTSRRRTTTVRGPYDGVANLNEYFSERRWSDENDDHDHDHAITRRSNDDLRYAIRALGSGTTTSVAEAISRPPKSNDDDDVVVEIPSFPSNDGRAETTAAAVATTTESSLEEYEEIRSVLQTFLDDEDARTLEFPKGQSSRIRKLVHHVAELMNLRHWSKGKRNSERFVIVAKRKKA